MKPTKRQLMINAFEQGNMKEVFRNAKFLKSHFDSEEMKVIQRAFESFHYSSFFAQLGHDPAEVQKSAKEIIQDRFTL